MFSLFYSFVIAQMEQLSPNQQTDLVQYSLKQVEKHKAKLIVEYYYNKQTDKAIGEDIRFNAKPFAIFRERKRILIELAELIIANFLLGLGFYFDPGQ